MKKLLVTTAVSAMIASTAFANANVGCGLGTMIIKPSGKSTIMQAFAATTNGTSGNQTFGISSGTLGCAQPSSFVSNDKLNKFVGENMDAIAMDIAKGSGENLDTLASLMNVSDHKAFAKKLQENFDAIYTSDAVSSANVIDNIAKLI